MKKNRRVIRKLILILFCCTSVRGVFASEGASSSISRDEQISLARERGKSAHAAMVEFVSKGAPSAITTSVSYGDCYTFFNCADFFPSQIETSVPVMTPAGLMVYMAKTSIPLLRDIVKLEHARDDKPLYLSRMLLTKAYKIHLMPSKTHFPLIMMRLLKRIANDREFAGLMRSIKAINAKDYLCLSVDHALIGVEKQLVLPMIVVYAAPGKEKAQRLITELATMCAGFRGITPGEATEHEFFVHRFPEWQSERGERYSQLVTPRFNVPYTDLIFYAQADADDKEMPELRTACFDQRFNSAVFTQAFLGYSGPLPEDYLLEGSPLGTLMLAGKQ